MSIIQLGALFTLGALWGASFIFIRIAVEPFGPVFLMFVRVTITALILLGYTSFRGIRLNIRGHWRRFLVLGLLGSALPFTLIAWSELTLTGSMAAILNSATPLFTGLMAAVALGERLTVYNLIGALLGIVGVTITVGGSPLTMDSAFILATLASLGAALSYAVGGVFAKRAFQGLSNMSMSTGQLIGATVILAPVSAFDLPQEVPSAAAIGAFLALVIACTAFAYQLYYYLIISAGPTKALTVTLLVPVFGVLWGALLLHEPISPGMIVGLVIVLFSVGLVTGMIAPGKRKPAMAKPSR